MSTQPTELAVLAHQFTNVSKEQLLRWKTSFPDYAKDVLKIRTRSGRMAPLVLNRMQRRLWEMIVDDIKQRKPVRMYVLKARQLGSSTFFEAFAYWLLSLSYAREGLVVAHDIPTARRLFSMMDLFWLLAEDGCRPIRRISNRKELQFENPKAIGTIDVGNLSRCEIATAENKNFGVGSTLHVVHLSELGRFPEVNKEIASTLVSMEQAIADEPETFVFYETTAWGMNLAFDMWCADSEMHRVFVSWIASEEYRLNEPVDMNHLATISDGQGYGDEAELVDLIKHELRIWYPEVLAAFGNEWLDFEARCRLAWRRRKLVSMRKTANDKTHTDILALFRREFPITAEEAFQTTGNNVFCIPALTNKITLLTQEPPSSSRFVFNSDDNTFVPCASGDLVIYETPVSDSGYVIGADVSEGLEDDNDYSAAQILSVPELVQVGVYEGVISPDVFAFFLHRLACWFNQAFVAVEITGPGLATQLKLRGDCNYTRLFRRRVPDGASAQAVNRKFGHSTNAATKPLLVNELRAAVDNSELTLLDVNTLKQLTFYVKTTNKNNNPKFGAVHGRHDDLVMALGLAYQMAQQVSWRFAKKSRAPRITVPYGTLAWWDQQCQSDGLPSPWLKELLHHENRA